MQFFVISNTSLNISGEKGTYLYGAKVVPSLDFNTLLKLHLCPHFLPMAGNFTSFSFSLELFLPSLTVVVSPVVPGIVPYRIGTPCIG
jgi:hypothetical protein